MREDPAPRAYACDRDVGRDLEHQIADEEHARAETEHGWRKPQILVHGQRGEADIHPVDEAHHIEQHHERDQPPGAFGEDAVLVHSAALVCARAIAAREAMLRPSASTMMVASTCPTASAIMPDA